MKIDKSNQLHLLDTLSKSSSVKNKQDTQAASQKSADTQDKVELSGWKQEVNRLKEKIKDIPEVREDKVAKVQEALANETYNVKGELVARNLLKSNLLDEIL